MCKITTLQYTCRHHIQHVWSACRGQVKAGKDSSTPACQKTPVFTVHASHMCGPCSRAEAAKAIRLELSIPNDQEPSTEQQRILQHRLDELQLPIANWRIVPTPSYSRKPRQKRRSRSPRRRSLLRDEVKPEDTCGPEAWESNIVPAAEDTVYETVSSGWDWEGTSETKSLTDEIAEDQAAERVARGEDEDDSQSSQDEEEGDESEAQAESEETQAEAEVPKYDNSSVKYWFRKHRSGTTFGRWELVTVSAN